MIRYHHVGQRLTYLVKHTSAVKYVLTKMFSTLPLSQFPSPIPPHLLLHLTFLNLLLSSTQLTKPWPAEYERICKS